MKRRLIIAIAGTVAAALLFAGLGTLLLVRRTARAEARRDLAFEATNIASAASELQPPKLAGLARALRLEGIYVLRVTPDGRLVGDLVSPVPLGSRDLERLASGQNVTGSTASGQVFAAAPIATPNRGLALVLLTRKPTNGLRGAMGWFVIAATGALLAAVAVATKVSDSIAAPLRQVEKVTSRIAAGDLTGRVHPTEGDSAEVQSLAQSVNKMAAQLERARRLDRQFLMSVSHELRTPLTSVKGFAEAIADGTAADSQRAAGVIGAESRRLERLVGDLLELAKLDAQQFSLDVRGVDVGEVLVDTAEGFRPAAEAAGVTLRVVEPAAAVWGAADPDRLAQIVANLIENALKFAVSSVSAGVEQTPDGPWLWVADDGPGISGDDLPHVFDRLFTTSRHAHRQVGSGLGLAIAHELVMAMNGSILAEPARQSGSRFSVRLRTWSTSTH